MPEGTPQDPGAEFDDPSDPQDLDPNIRVQLRQSRKVAKEAKEATARAEAAERELAFTRAGVPEDGAGSLLRKAYDGELTPEAIKAAAEGYGLTFGQQTGTSTDPTDAELEALRKAQQATSGTTGAGPQARDWVAEIEAAPDKDAVMALIDEARAAGIRS